MAAVNAGVEVPRIGRWTREYYWRWVDDFRATGRCPVDELRSITASSCRVRAMLVPQTLQAYVVRLEDHSASMAIPWDVGIGAELVSR